MLSSAASSSFHNYEGKDLPIVVQERVLVQLQPLLLSQLAPLQNHLPQSLQSPQTHHHSQHLPCQMVRLVLSRQTRQNRRIRHLLPYRQTFPELLPRAWLRTASRKDPHLLPETPMQALEQVGTVIGKRVEVNHQSRGRHVRYLELKGTKMLV